MARQLEVVYKNGAFRLLCSVAIVEDQRAIVTIADEGTLSSNGVKEPQQFLKNGAELVAYWKQERLIGTRPEIADGAEHARLIRQRAQTRQQ